MIPNNPNTETSNSQESHPLCRRERPLASESRNTPFPTKPDRLLLLPILESPDAPVHDPVCLHLVHLPDGSLGLCNTKSTQRCPCCGLSMCPTHQSTRTILIPSDEAAWTGSDLPLLCEVCASLSKEQIYLFHLFRTSINE